MTGEDWRERFLERYFRPEGAKKQKSWLMSLWRLAKESWGLGDAVAEFAEPRKVAGTGQTWWVPVRRHCRNLGEWRAEDHLWTRNPDGTPPGFAFKIPVTRRGWPRKWSFYIHPARGEPLRLDYDASNAGPVRDAAALADKPADFVEALVFHPPLHLHVELPATDGIQGEKARLTTACMNPWLVCYQAVVQFGVRQRLPDGRRPTPGVEPRHDQSHKTLLQLAETEKRRRRCECRRLFPQAG